MKEGIHATEKIQITRIRKNQEDLDTEESPETETNGRYVHNIDKLFTILGFDYGV